MLFSDPIHVIAITGLAGMALVALLLLATGFSTPLKQRMAVRSLNEASIAEMNIILRFITVPSATVDEWIAAEKERENRKVALQMLHNYKMKMEYFENMKRQR